MSLSKAAQKMADAIRESMDEGVVTGDELLINAPGALEKSLEGSGITKEQYDGVIEHHTKFVTALAGTVGEVGIEKMSENAEVNNVVINVPVSDHAGHTARIARCHEPVEGKPQYGHIQVHSAFQMDENTSSEFKKVVRSIGKRAKEAFESQE